MRISTLVLFLFGLLVAGVAPAPGQTADDSLQSVPSLKFDLANADGLAIDHYRWDESLAHLTVDNIRPAQDQVCYTMRSYKVERTERMNESKAPMKYSSCQPSSGFDVKNADVDVAGPETPQEQP
jgi:hypothetical protein